MSPDFPVFSRGGETLLHTRLRLHTPMPPEVDPEAPPSPEIDPDPAPAEDDPLREPNRAPEGDPPAGAPPLSA